MEHIGAPQLPIRELGMEDFRELLIEVEVLGWSELTFTKPI
jgi:hypothetical protein